MPFSGVGVCFHLRRELLSKLRAQSEDYGMSTVWLSMVMSRVCERHELKKFTTTTADVSSGVRAWISYWPASVRTTEYRPERSVTVRMANLEFHEGVAVTTTLGIGSPPGDRTVPSIRIFGGSLGPGLKYRKFLKSGCLTSACTAFRRSAAEGSKRATLRTRPSPRSAVCSSHRNHNSHSNRHQMFSDIFLLRGPSN